MTYNIKCPVCGNEDLTEEFDEKQEVPYHECRACDTSFTIWKNKGTPKADYRYWSNELVTKID